MAMGETAPRFDRRELIMEFIGRENVSFGRYDEPLATKRDSTTWTDWDMTFRIGALCIVEIEFAQVGSQPEMASVSILHSGHQQVYEAGKHAAEDIVDETIAAAKGYRYLAFSADEPYRLDRRTRSKLSKFAELMATLETTGKVHLDGNKPYEPLPDGMEHDDEASRILGGAVQRAGLGSERPYTRDDKRSVAYEDVSWEEGSFQGKDRVAMPAIVEALRVWPEVFPDYEITGCGESAIRFERAGFPGELWMEHRKTEDWRNGRRLPNERYCVDLSFEPRNRHGAWHGDARADWPHHGDYQEDALGSLADDLRECADAFKASVASVLEAPIVVDDIDLASSYRETWGTRRAYYPTSTPRELEAALRACGAYFPIDLARAIVGGEDLSAYSQRKLDEQHDVEYVMDGVIYDPEAGALQLDDTTTECAHIDRLPTTWDVKRTRATGFTPERLGAVAELEPIPEPKPNPYFVEWTIYDRHLDDGTVEYRVREFPDLATLGKDSYDAYHQLYDLIGERIAELQAAGKPVPTPLGFQEREAFHQEWLAQSKGK